jgi:transposase
LSKTDRVNVRKLARALCDVELNPIYVPSRVIQEDRSLVRIRMRLVIKQTRCKNQIKVLLGFYGITIADDLAQSHLSIRFLEWIEQFEIDHTSGSNAMRGINL